MPAREGGLARDCTPPRRAETVRARASALQTAQPAERGGVRILLRQTGIGG